MNDDLKFNARNPAVKRILQEIKEFQHEICPDMMAEALEENIFEWHFAIRGPPDTDFEGGIYHGRILMPSDYPFKPPSFILLTANGRFETGVKICLSISSHHPEHWQPSWSVRTALTALIAFFPSPGGGAIGSLEYPKDDRRKLAEKSRKDPPDFGNASRQEVTRRVHARMLDAENTEKTHRGENGAGAEEGASAGSEQLLGSLQPDQQAASAVPKPIAREAMASPSVVPNQAVHPCTTSVSMISGNHWEDRSLGLLAAALTIAIVAILGRRLLLSAGVDLSDFFR